jgi:hypothetical protein
MCLKEKKDPYSYSYICCFYNLYSDCVFTSQKVCLNSFHKITNELKKAKRIYDIDPSYNLHCLVRNPYSRIESLYKDKLLCSIVKNNPQNCQLEIMKVFGENSFYDKKITFEQFVIEGLPILFDKESHFFPQSVFIPQFVSNVYHLEIKKELNYVFSLFCDNEYHEHKTYDYSFEWTSNMKDVVSSVYGQDFYRFSYDI